MNKNKRMVSLLGFDQNFTGMFASYCHLLKPHLKENWLLNRIDEKPRIAIVSEDYNGKVCKKTKVKIFVKHSDTFATYKKINSKQHEFTLSYPISSVKILDVLNKISNLTSLKKKKLSRAKEVFSFKNIFSSFMNTRKLKREAKHELHTNKPHKVANKLLNILNPHASETLKVVFLGRPGSGKTTAISSVAAENVLTSEVSATDSVNLIKQQTTIGIDYGECQFENGTKLRLYGTPGQRRYDYVQAQTVTRADIYIILVDLSSVAPFAEFLYYKDIIKSSGNEDALCVVAFTHYDLKEHNMAQLSKEIRLKCHGEILTVKIDTRVRDEVHFMLEKSAQMKLGDMKPEKYYADNSLFLKNINA